MAKPKERELSALELMIEHAEGLNSSVVGMPKGRKRKASNQPDFSFDFNDYDAPTDDDQEYYVGPGSRAKNREARARRAEREKAKQLDININTTPEPRVVSQAPNPREVEGALEELFSASERSGDNIVKAINSGTAVSQKTQEALEEWLKWEKSEAFKEKNKAKSDPHGNQPGAGGGSAANDGPDDNGPDLLDDMLDGGDGRRRTGGRRRRGRRYGRNSGNRRGTGRNLPKRRIPLGERFGGLRKFGKVGKIAALGLTAAGALGAGMWLKDKSNEEAEQSNANNSGVGTPEQPVQIQQDVQKADNAADQKIEAEAPKAPSAAQDVAVAGASMLLMGAAKKIPVVGPALGNGLMLANDVQHINADQDMTDAEKEQAKKKATGSAVGGAAGGSLGAVAGGWIGGILGSVVPVAGTAAGAALGATIGGILGDYFGSSVGEYVSDKITDESDKMLADGEKDRKEKMDEYNDTTLENLDKTKAQAPVIMPFNLGGLAGGLPGSGAGTYQGPMRAQPARRMDSKQVTDIANKAIAEGGLGSVSEQFESGGRGVGTISTGQGDAGGVSYGKHQLATNNGSMMNFLNSPEGKPFLARFGGLAPGTAQFNSVYKDIAVNQGADLDKAQSDYITRTHYAPMVAKLQNDVGVDLSKRGAGVKELVYSTAVQYGAGSSVVANALRGKDVNGMSDEELIKTIQDYKAATTDRYFKSSSAQTQQSVATRAQNEKDVLLKVAEADKKKKEAVNTDQSPSPASQSSKDVVAASGGSGVADSRTPFSDELDRQVRKEVMAETFTKKPSTEVLPKEVTQDANRIEPTVQPEPTIARQPLVSEGDIARQEAPEPAQVVQAPAATPAPAATAKSSPQQPVPPQGRPGNAHSLDSIPVFMDDPMLNMITMGYM